MNIFLMNLINRLISMVNEKCNLFCKIIASFLLVPLFVIYSLIEAVFLLFFSPYKSFTFNANQNKKGTYKVSYDDHIKFKKKTRLFSVTSICIVLVSVLAVNIISTVFLNFNDVETAYAYSANTWTNGNSNNQWHDPGNWSLGHEPTSTENATFNATSNTNANITGTPVNVGGITLAVGYTQTVNAGSQDVTVATDGINVASGVFNSGSGSIDINGSFIFAGGNFFASSGNMYVSGAWTHTAGGNFNHNSGTVIFDGLASTLDVSGAETLNNVQFTKNNNNALTVANGDAIIVIGVATLNSGYINRGDSNSAIEVRKDVIVGSSYQYGNIKFNFENSTIDQSFTGAGLAAWSHPIIINKGGGAVNQGADLSIMSESFTVSNGTYNTNNFGFTTSNSPFVLNNGTFNSGSSTMMLASGFTIGGGTFNASTGTFSVNGNWTHTGPGTFNHNNGTVIFYGGASNIDVNAAEIFYNVQVNKNNINNLTVASGDAIIVTNTAEFNDGYLQRGDTNSVIEVRGNVIVGDLYDYGNIKVNFENSTIDQSFTGAGLAAWSHPIIINKGGGAVNQGADLSIMSESFTVSNGTYNTNNFGFTTSNSPFVLNNGTFNSGSSTMMLASGFTIGGGTFNASTGTFSVNGNWTHTGPGTFNHNNGTVIFYGGSSNFDIGATETFYNVQINKNNINSLNITAGRTLLSTGLLTLSNGYVHTGLLEARGSVTVASDFDCGTFPLLKFSGTANQIFTLTGAEGIINNDITIDKPSGKVSLASALIMDNSSQDLDIVSGTFDLSGQALTVSGGGGTFQVQNAGNFQMQGGETITAAPILNSGSTVTYNNTSGTSIIKDYPYRNLVIDGSGGVFQLATNTVIASNLTINAGTLSLAGYDLLLSGTFSNNGILQLRGNERVTLTNDSDSGTWRYVGNGNAANDSFAIQDTTYNNLEIDMVDNGDTASYTGFTAGTLSDYAARWKLEEAAIGGADSIIDSSGNGHHGTPVNFTLPEGPSDQVPTVNFTDTKSWDFDGSADVITTNYNIDQSGDIAISMAAWVKPESTSSGNHVVIGTDNSGFDWGIYRVGSNWVVPTGSSFWTTGKTVTAGVWQHVAVVYQPGVGTKFYLNGVEVMTGTISYDTSDNNIAIGKSPGYDEFWDGLIDEVLVYERSLSPEEVGILASGEDNNDIDINITNLPINGNFTLANGVFSAPANINLKGNWVRNGGSYIHNNNTVNLIDNSVTSILFGNTNFYNLSSTASGKTINFTSGSTQTVSNNLVLTGANGNLLTLRSTINDNAWSLNANGAVTVNYVNVKDSDASGGNLITQTNSVNAGNNLNWNFNNSPSASTTLYANNTSTTAQAGDVSPINLIDFTPALSAIYNDNDSGDIANKWQIEVDTQADFAGTDMWLTDGSGLAMDNVTAGNRCSDVEYGGSALTCGTTYYWRIKFWDDDNTAGAWSAPANFEINCAPVVSADTSSGDEDTVQNIDLSHSDGDGDGVIYSVVSNVSNGVLTLVNASNGTYTYNPTSNYNGTDTFTYKVNDGTQDSNTETVTITINPINDKPLADAGASQTVSESVESATLDGTGSSDYDTGDSLTYSWLEAIDSADACGLNNPTTALPTVDILNKESNYNCTFNLIVNDGTIASEVDTTTLYVIATNDLPILDQLNDSVSVKEGAQLTILPTASDPDTNTLTLSAISSPVGATFTDNGNNRGAFSWTPNYDQQGEYAVTFRASDGNSADNQEVNITVEDVATNQTPICVNNIDNISFYKNVTINPIDLNDYCTDPDGDELTFTAVGNDDVQVEITNGLVSLSATKATQEAIYFQATDSDGGYATTNASIVTVSNLRNDDIGYVTGSSKGPGVVTVVDNNGNSIASWTAFNKGGAIARLEGKKVFVIKNKPGSTIHAYTATGKLLDKQRISKKVHWRKMASGNLDKNTKTYEVVTATKRGSTIYMKLYKFENNKFKLAKRTKHNHVREAFRVKINDSKKKFIIVINNKGNTVFKWEPFAVN